MTAPPPQVVCDGAAGCRAAGPSPGYDALFRSPLPGNVGAPCAACFRGPADPDSLPPGGGGLGVVALPGAAAGCRTGGILTAVPAVRGDAPGPGSGFVARFEAAAGAVTALTVDDYGQGYKNASVWRVVPAAGGAGCVQGAFRPVLVAPAPCGYLEPGPAPPIP